MYLWKWCEPRDQGFRGWLPSAPKKGDRVAEAMECEYQKQYKVKSPGYVVGKHIKGGLRTHFKEF